MSAGDPYQGDPYQGEPPGPLGYMAGNGVAANLLMLGIVLAGLVSLTGLVREAWPVLSFNTIEVAVAWRGANPGEIEESIIEKIEDQVRGLKDVHKVRSVAAPGIASVLIEMKTSADMGEALDNIESAVSRIDNFPEGAERPVIAETDNSRSAVRLVIHGDVGERALKGFALQVESELAALPEVTRVEVSGARDYEISIEVPARRLRALGLTLEDIAAAIRDDSLNLPAGRIETTESQVRLRTLGQRYVQRDFEDIVILARDDGAALRLGDIGIVRDGFRDSDLILRNQGEPAVFVEVFSAPNEQVNDIANAVLAHIAGAVEPAAPDGIGITVWNDESRQYTERAEILLKNGGLGLLLVLIALALFLEIRLAFWVSVGLAVTFIGALAVMLLFGISISTVSLFVFVLAIGIVVDDAIIVAESIDSERGRGTPALAAAIRGTRRIALPLTFAVLTSIAAFMPLLFIPGGLGELWRPLPVIVIGMLAISLVESLFVLPHHLSNLRGGEEGVRSREWPAERHLARIQQAVRMQLQRFSDGPLQRMLVFTTAQPLVIIAGAVAALVLSISLIPAGIVQTTFADIVQSDFVTATVEMPDGTVAARTAEVAEALRGAGLAVIEDAAEERELPLAELLMGDLLMVGQGPRFEGGSVSAEPSLNPRADLAFVQFKLVSAQDRDVTTIELAQRWREAVGVLPYVRNVSITGEALTLGNAVEAKLSHPDPARLAMIADETIARLREVGGVFDARSDYVPDIREIQLRLLPEARSLGLTADSLANQARDAFVGAEAQRIQRDGEELRVMVRLPEAERNSISDIERYPIRVAGGDVPLSQVAAVELAASATSIRREEGQRVITVAADVDLTEISANEANAILAGEILAELAETHPDLVFEYGGVQAQQIESLDSLYRGFAIALLLIYSLLAIPLRSYGKPLIIMSIIPFGLIGVILGHWVLGIPVGASTVMGVLGLSGVLVNDSLVMVDLIGQRIREGMAPRQAVIEGAKGRFRPILLTSITTFLGFTPLIFESSIQAQFFLPFAASLGIGILVATGILMLLVPAISILQLELAAPRAKKLRTA
ncbi:MAG: efflux RND transporter permease subunit [Gammaproteobacteria bacterium]|nr:efflux RND transporter permease subunit [Gammaproteobacteria bacterium]